jgi:hypothetical protein
MQQQQQQQQPNKQSVLQAEPQQHLQSVFTYRWAQVLPIVAGYTAQLQNRGYQKEAEAHAPPLTSQSAQCPAAQAVGPA